MSKHDKVATNLAKKLGAEYKPNKGIDIVTPEKVVEVEVKKSGTYQGIKQVEKSSKARYLAVPPDLRKEARKATEGTGIGIMGTTGAIIKRASRKDKS